MPPRIRKRTAGRPTAESLRGGTGERVGRGRRGRRPREGNDEHVDDLNVQGNDQGIGANGGVEGVNGNVEGANGGAPDFSTIIAQQLQNREKLLEKIDHNSCIVGGSLAKSANHRILSSSVEETFIKVLSWKLSSISSSLNSSRCGFSSHGKWPAATFSAPFLFLISISNCWSSKIQRIRRSLASCLANRYFNAELGTNAGISDVSKQKASVDVS
ncbi:hypothetical protein Tco_0860551 [Tanacetum coccineum]|uniref:Uncharacterized protein n=1 Tax=Tanacetum coccineum TaxID=301880 RepID=A0ABQ5BKZ1_9ASTR